MTCDSTTRDAAPTVSVVIPTYRSEPYLRECVQSVLTQDIANVEVLVVDDASPDGSSALAQAMARADARVRLLSSAVNTGIGPTRNRGAAAARGQYLFFLDADDRLSAPDVLSQMIEDAQRHSARVVACSADRLMPDGACVPLDRVNDKEWRGRPDSFVPADVAFRACLGAKGEGYAPMRAWGLLFERAFYNSLELDFPTGEHEDMAWVPFLYLQAGGVYYQKKVGVHYRWHPTSVSNQPWPIDKVQRYARLWAITRARLERFGRHHDIGDTALAFTEHLLWRMENSQGDAPVDTRVFSVIAPLMKDALQARHHDALLRLVDRLYQAPWHAAQTAARHRVVLQHLPAPLLLERMSHQVAEMGAAAVAHAAPCSTQITHASAVGQETHVLDAVFLCERSLQAHRANQGRAASPSGEQPRGTRYQQPENLQAELEQTRAVLNAVLTSPYWRATAPLRHLGSRFPRLTRGLRRGLSPLLRG